MPTEQGLGQEVPASKRRSVLLVLVSLVLGVVIGAWGAGRDWTFLTRSYALTTYLPPVAGLKLGAQVAVAGMPAGRVTAIDLVPGSSEPVKVSMKVSLKYRSAIRADSQASITTAGLLGDSYINITLGSASQQVVAPGGVVRSADARASTSNCSRYQTRSRKPSMH